MKGKIVCVHRAVVFVVGFLFQCKTKKTKQATPTRHATMAMETKMHESGQDPFVG